jgi:hypothetical protein
MGIRGSVEMAMRVYTCRTVRGGKQQKTSLVLVLC